MLFIYSFKLFSLTKIHSLFISEMHFKNIGSIFYAWKTMVGTGEQDRNVDFLGGVQNLVGDEDKQRGISQIIAMIRRDLWLIHLPC